MIDVGEVLEVVIAADRAVFLRVQLRYRQVEGLVRWCSQNHGAGWGSWWVPSVGADVVCMFPGAGYDGRIDDVDEGFAVAVVSTKPEPPVNGLEGALSAERRVFKGRPGEAQDDHYQGAHDITIDGPQRQALKSTRETTVDGNETRLFKANRTATVEGDEARTNEGALAWAVQGTLDWTVDGDETRANAGALTTETDGAVSHLHNDTLEVVTEGNETRESGGTLSWVLRGIASFLGDVLVKLISQSEIQIAAPVVRLGAEAAAKRVLHEDFIAQYNAHTHYVGFASGPGYTQQTSPAASAGPGTTSEKARVDNG